MMYALHLNAVPDETNQEYRANQSYSVFMIVNTFSEEAAIAEAELALREKHWKDIQLQQIGKVPRENEAAGDPIPDSLIYVFSEDEQSRLHKLKNEAKALYDSLARSKD